MGNEISPEVLSKLTSLKQTGTSQHIVLDDKKINIGNLLNHMPNKINGGAKEPNVISKEKYTYGKQQGILIKYDDGTLVFRAMNKTKGQSIVSELKFNKEKDIDEKKPSSFVTYDYKHPENKITTNYKYHRNGNLSQSQTVNAKGTVLRDTEYNKKGKPEEVKIYDKNGKLLKSNHYTYNKDNNVEIAAYDKDNKLISTTSIQYAADGKTKVSAQKKDAEGNIIAVSKYDDKGKLSSSQEFHKNGKIKSETEYYDNGVIKTQIQYDENGKQVKEISPEIDGHFGNSAQISEGDCYLLASINSIRNTEQGQAMLKDLVSVSTNDKGEKVYTVEFPGAKVAAEGLKNDNRIDPNKMYITGKYTFTESEMQEILKHAGKEYSLGDGDVILLEAAFEKYRHEVNKTLEANNLDKKTSRIGEAGLQTGTDEENILSGGRSEDAVFVLTGKQSQLYMNNKVKNGLSYEALQAGEADVVSIMRSASLGTNKAVSQIDGKITASQKDLNRMLDDIMKDSKDGTVDSIAVAGFPVVHEDGTIGGHALTIKSVTEDTVTLVNPWHPDKELTMSRQEFLKSARSLSLSDVNKPNVQVPDSGNGTNPAASPSPTPSPNNNITNPTPENTSEEPAAGATYTVPQGITYTNMIKSALKAQGIDPTPENIQKAKSQFEAANPGAVHTYNGKRQEWHGNKYLLAKAQVNIPQFKM